jgi:hypothetical protein
MAFPTRFGILPFIIVFGNPFDRPASAIELDRLLPQGQIVGGKSIRLEPKFAALGHFGLLAGDWEHLKAGIAESVIAVELLGGVHRLRWYDTVS